MELIKQNKMGSAPMTKLILSMSLPAMFSMLVQALYNIIDSMFVSYYSQDALTAVSLAFPIQMLIISVAVGTGIGINSLVSRRLGEKRYEEANQAANHGILLAVFSWIVFAIIGILFTRMFFNMFTDKPLLIEMGTKYTSIVTILSVGIFVEIAIEKVFQATGKMMYSMVIQLSGAIINIILDPILIFGLFGLPKMGIAGAAFATVIGQIFSMFLAIYLVFTKSKIVKISFKNFKMRFKIIKDIYAVGIPSMIMQAIGSVLNTCLNGILIKFSNEAVAVLGIYYKLQSFVFMPVFGLTHGVMPIMGYNYGARNKKRLLSALKVGIIIATIIMTAGTILFWTIPDLLLKIFNANDEVLRIGVIALRSISLSFIPAALGIIMSTLFQAVGMGGKSLFVSILRQLVIILPVSYLLSNIGLNYVWLSFVIAEVVSFVASIVIFLDINKKHISVLKDPIE